ncbi:LOW QUALITY PROTEIN: double-strand-break repair protein rad21-like protein 1 [Trematomus bernacchii]|uniref:LOW QUALITY PROTEIN: double-strand-break repair protein rad21-like protein 1 n=1 Tax=Trematomus bernacchii TaxID=40690 RepID=UPI00146B1254|nr:LOW QUALITY PROTEIN: double-strand-break repair protein rad21-like protein 1 [Trematomus bernacchii]
MIFYTQLFTSKRGPLAKIWLAAHWERKLTKAQVFECNLETTIKDIISPEMKIGLRTSGHLLVGVVRIYSKKAKYLLADSTDALVKIKFAFRPGQTDLPDEGLEATLKAITLNEDFPDFDTQLPHPSNIDHFSLNQCRSEDITLKEDIGSGFLNLIDFGNDSQSISAGLLDFQGFSQQGDAFGDEDRAGGFLDFLTNSENPESSELNPEEPENTHISTLEDQRDPDWTEVVTPTQDETTLLTNEKEGFALDPVAVTPNSEKRRGKRKRRLVVDQSKELSNESIREQLSNCSDLIAPLDMAPPTLQLMQWKESGRADKLFAQLCSTVAAPQIKKLFAKTIFQVKLSVVHQEVEVMRKDGRDAQRDITVVDSSIDQETTYNTDVSDLGHMTDNQGQNNFELREDGNMSDFTHPELPSEDSMFVHPSCLQTQSSSLHTQSLLESQDLEEKKLTRRTQNVLHALKSSRSSLFSLQALCKGRSRFQAATTFFCFLVLKKQNSIQLQQSAPYDDIIASPGPTFYEQ